MNEKISAMSVAVLALVMASILVSQTPQETNTSDSVDPSSEVLAFVNEHFWNPTGIEIIDSYSNPIVDSSKRPLKALKPGEWGPCCNSELLAGPFSLKNAPDFNVSQLDLNRITEVIDELKSGYGGTLVTAPLDPVLDSSAFLAHYLREFGNPDNIRIYDYLYERILERLYRSETVLDDGRLDWDIWRAYLLFENYIAGSDDANTFEMDLRGDTVIANLDSAKDLLWGYLDRNAEIIRQDKERLRWWVEALTTDLKKPGGRPMRRWFLLQLVASTDTKTAELLKEQRIEEDGGFSFIQPDPFNPFIILGSHFILIDQSYAEPLGFLRAIEKIATSQKLSYEIWGIDTEKMPSTKAVQTDLAPRRSQFAQAIILSQESWSNHSESFAVGFSRPIGRRAAYCNARIPISDRKDGVFFFSYNARLYVWPKSKMDAATIQMMHTSGLIDDASYSQFQTSGFDPLPRTSESVHQ